MGANLYVEEMEEGPNSDDSYKDGFAPSIPTSIALDMCPFNFYGTLDPPAPIKQDGFLDYPMHDTSGPTSRELIPPFSITTTEPYVPRQAYEQPLTTAQSIAPRPTYTMLGNACPYYQPREHHSRRIPYSQHIDSPDSASLCASYFNFSQGVESNCTPVAGHTPPQVCERIYTPLQPVCFRVHASFDQPSSSLGVSETRRASLPQTLSRTDKMSFTRPQVDEEPSNSRRENLTHPLIKSEAFEDPRGVGEFSRRDDPPTPFTPTDVVKEKQFACTNEGCDKRFARVDELKRHQRTHSDIRPFTCSHCEKGFTRSDHLITHRRTHTGEKPYACPLCNRCFARSDERSRHVRTHQNQRPNANTRGRRQSTAATRKQKIQITTPNPVLPSPHAVPYTQTYQQRPQSSRPSISGRITPQPTTSFHQTTVNEESSSSDACCKYEDFKM